MDRVGLIRTLRSYSTKYPEEEGFTSKFLTLLEHPRCYFRDHLPGHITGSAWIIDSQKSTVLLTHHAKLDKWLQPGGHADGDENILDVACTEVLEETGIKIVTKPVSFFDIDIHPIPARDDFPQHDHYDVRFLFECSSSHPLKISNESKDLKWIKWDDVNNYIKGNRSINRMLDKTTRAYPALC